ncbi:MAG TPA: hypothetical protein VHM28_08745 [Anaerolineales bacterium]|nr:hypothetical protein [Anaerolineales bacterium]
MDYLKIVLRFIHIGAGVFWVGTAIFNTFFLGPAVAAVGEGGQKVMAQLVTKAKLSMRVSAAAIATVLAGAWLYWIDSDGLTSTWKNSGPGIGFGIGGLLAIVGLVFGLMVGRNTYILGKIAAEVQGKPTPEQMSRIEAARKQLGYAGPISTISLMLSLVFMAIARYLVF